MRSLSDRVAHNTVQPDRRKDQSHRCEDSKKQHCEALLLDGSGDDLIERPDARDRLFLIDREHLAADSTTLNPPSAINLTRIEAQSTVSGFGFWCGSLVSASRPP